MTAFAIDETHDPGLSSWVAGALEHPEFPVQNLPLGVFTVAEEAPRPGAAIGDLVVDLAGLAGAGLLPDLPVRDLHATRLNGLFAWRAEQRQALRRGLVSLLTDETHRAAVTPWLVRQADATLHLPARIGDYTDFYAGIHHATNVGSLFRPDKPLLDNYKYMPIGYHGRASSIRVSGVPVVRPAGQWRSGDETAPRFGPSRRLDYELELGIWLGSGNALGEPIAIGAAGARIAGLCLLNDWSARDVQAWEYQPLGPFLAKNFHTTISPWVVTAEALAPFRIPQPPRPAGDPAPLPYLWDTGDQAAGAFQIELTVALRTRAMRDAGLHPHRLSRGSAANLYWTAAQMIAHHTVNGCNLNAGDLFGTGTISAPAAGGFGSLLEITEGGRRAIALPGGESRTFLEAGDEVLISAVAHADNRVSIGFGSCAAMLV